MQKYWAFRKFYFLTSMGYPVTAWNYFTIKLWNSLVHIAEVCGQGKRKWLGTAYHWDHVKWRELTKFQEHCSKAYTPIFWVGPCGLRRCLFAWLLSNLKPNAPSWCIVPLGFWARVKWGGHAKFQGDSPSCSGWAEWDIHTH